MHACSIVFGCVGMQDASLEDLKTHTLSFATASGRTDNMSRRDDIDDYVVCAVCLRAWMTCVRMHGVCLPDALDTSSKLLWSSHAPCG